MPGKLKGKDGLKKEYDRKVPCDCVKDIEEVKCDDVGGKPLFVFCGQGGNAQFSSPNEPPVNIASVTVEGRGLKKPLVKIKFSSVINLTTPDGNDPQALLTFRLFRICDGGISIPLNNWTYEVFNINNVSNPLRFIDSFVFLFCDRLNNSRLCDYFVEVSIDNLVNATISIDNVQIHAIAQ